MTEQLDGGSSAEKGKSFGGYRRCEDVQHERVWGRGRYLKPSFLKELLRPHLKHGPKNERGWRGEGTETKVEEQQWRSVELISSPVLTARYVKGRRSCTGRSPREFHTRLGIRRVISGLDLALSGVGGSKAHGSSPSSAQKAQERVIPKLALRIIRALQNQGRGALRSPSCSYVTRSKASGDV